MKAKDTIRRELRKVEALLNEPLTRPDHDAAYGAMQALSWVLDLDAEAASKSFTAREPGRIGAEDD